MHNRFFFCTGVKLLLSGASTAFWNTDQCYKNTPALGSKQEPLWRFLQTAQELGTRVSGVKTAGIAAVGHLQEGCVGHRALAGDSPAAQLCSKCVSEQPQSVVRSPRVLWGAAALLAELDQLGHHEH